jgi:small subunit ribosomal protein S16
MLIIRLQRTGKRHAPSYRLVVAEKARSVSKKIQEVLGTYSPATKVLVLKQGNTLEIHLKNNIQMSETVASILKKNTLLK